MIATVFVFLTLLLASSQATSQPQTESGVLPPPKVGLFPVPFPGIQDLEEPVQDQFRTAREAFAKAAQEETSSDSDLSEVYGFLGQLFHTYQFTEAAQASYLNANRLSPEDFRWVYLLGQLYLKVGKLAQAALYLEAATSLGPSYLATHVHLGNVYLQMDRAEEAQLEFETVLAGNPESPSAHSGLGELELKRNNYSAAVQHLEAVLEQVPQANRIHYLLALAYRGIGELEKAKAHLERRGPVGVRPRDPLLDSLQDLKRGERVYLLRGRLAFNAGQFEEAVEAFALAVQAAPESCRARVNLGSALAKVGKNLQAITEFRTCLRHDPANGTAHYNLATLYAEAGQRQQAIHHFEALLEVDPEDQDARRQLAELLFQEQRWEEAMDAFRRVGNSNQEDPDVLLRVAQILVRQQQYGEALRQLEDGHQQFPRSGGIAHALARLLAASPDLSLRDGERALELAQMVFAARNTPGTTGTVALALAESGQCEEAANWQKKLIELLGTNQNPERTQELQTTLARYLAGAPCRPNPEGP